MHGLQPVVGLFATPLVVALFKILIPT